MELSLKGTYFLFLLSCTCVDPLPAVPIGQFWLSGYLAHLLLIATTFDC